MRVRGSRRAAEPAARRVQPAGPDEGIVATACRPGVYTRAMKWASFVSGEPDLHVAVHQAAGQVRARLGGLEPDLVLVFVSAHHADDYPEVPGAIRLHMPLAHVVGCSGGGVVGGGREIEHGPAVSITAAHLPDVRVQPFHLDPSTVDALAAEPELWHTWVEPGRQPPHFLLLPDPFSCDARELIASLDVAYPGSVKVGGLASGSPEAGGNALFLDDAVFPDGAVGLALGGDIEVDAIVAQGCRPIGSPLFVTRAFRNRILELDGRRPTEVLTELYHELDPADRELFGRALFLGVVMTAGRDRYEHGDFLIRNIVGLDGESGVIAVAEQLEPGQVVQFHLRDAASSRRDLERLLRRYSAQNGQEPEAVLLFSCLGRGEGLYGEPDHDSRLIAEYLGGAPVGGFFCAGEIGPVEQRTFLHGYTSSIAVLRRRRRAD